MSGETDTGANLLRLVGLMAIAVGIAWAVQVAVLGSDGQGVRTLWIMAAAAICGAGVGAVAVSGQLPRRDAVALSA